jgi:hypothetical protein
MNATSFSGAGLRPRCAALLVGAGLLMAGCASNPTTPTPPPAPVVMAPPPAPVFDMGPPSATFVYLANAVTAYESTGAGGTGTLFYNGKRYTFNAAGVSAAPMGQSPGPISGEVYGLKHLRDMNGTYTGDMMPGGKEAVLKNPEGVTLHVTARSGLKLTVTSVTIKLNYR